MDTLSFHACGRYFRKTGSLLLRGGKIISYRFSVNGYYPVVGEVYGYIEFLLVACPAVFLSAALILSGITEVIKHL